MTSVYLSSSLSPPPWSCLTSPHQTSCLLTYTPAQLETYFNSNTELSLPWPFCLHQTMDNFRTDGVLFTLVPKYLALVLLINTFSNQWESELENREVGKKLGSIMELRQKKVMKCIRTVCPLSELEIHRTLNEDEHLPPATAPPSTVIHRQTLKAKHTRGQSYSVTACKCWMHYEQRRQQGQEEVFPVDQQTTLSQNKKAMTKKKKKKKFLMF